jgi:hypothetical protein
MDLELHAHNMRLLFDSGYGNAACELVQQFGPGGIAERLVKLLEQRSEVETLRAQLAAANAQRDELLRVGSRIAKALYDICESGYETQINDWNHAVARAQSGQPAQRDDDGTASGGFKP